MDTIEKFLTQAKNCLNLIEIPVSRATYAQYLKQATFIIRRLIVERRLAMKMVYGKCWSCKYNTSSLYRTTCFICKFRCGPHAWSYDDETYNQDKWEYKYSNVIEFYYQSMTEKYQEHFNHNKSEISDHLYRHYLNEAIIAIENLLAELNAAIELLHGKCWACAYNDDPPYTYKCMHCINLSNVRREYNRYNHLEDYWVWRES